MASARRRRPVPNLLAWIALAAPGGAVVLQRPHIGDPTQPGQGRGGFLDLHTIYYRAETRRPAQGIGERNEEFCVTLQKNLQNPLVNSVTLYSEYDEKSTNSDLDECKLTGKSRMKLVVTGPANVTYKVLFTGARFKKADDRLQVILNGDIILGEGWDSLRSCVRDVHEKQIAFHLTRTEPKTCYPLLDGRPNHQNRRKAPLEEINYCATDNARFSHDALAFSGNISDKILVRLGVPPYRMGAENLLSCRLKRYGRFDMQNPCDQLKIYHNHCDDARFYPQDKRIDKPPFAPYMCYHDAVDKTHLQCDAKTGSLRSQMVDVR